MIVLFEGLTQESSRECKAILKKAGLEFETQGRKDSVSILLIEHDQRATACDKLVNAGFVPQFSNRGAVILEFREDLDSLPNVRSNQSEFGRKSGHVKNYFRISLFFIFAMTLALSGLTILSLEYYLSLTLAEQIHWEQKIPAALRSMADHLTSLYEDLRMSLHSE